MTMRLLYVIDSLAPGGAETSLAAMAPGLIAGGIDLHVLPLAHRLDLAQKLEEAGATVHAPPQRTGRLQNVRSVLETARAIEPHLIHTTLFESDIAGRTAARILGIPASTSLVNDSYGSSHYAESSTAKLHAARALDVATARFAVRFHAISQAIADNVPPRLHVSPNNVVVIPRGRDPRMFPFRPTQLRESTRQSLGLQDGAPVILSVGRLEPQKGYQNLLLALPAVARKYPDLVVLIAGKEGRTSEDLRAKATELNLDIRFLGHRTDVPDLLAAADLFCFPSEREGFGGVLIEAMAVGCPVVASSIPTTLEVLGSGNSSAATITPVGDTEALADGIIRVLSAQNPVPPRTRHGRARFEELFTLDGVVARMVDFFLENA